MSPVNRTVRKVVVWLLVAGSVLLLGAIATDGSPVVDWPWLQAHAHEFYVVKGLTAVVATVLLIAHMMQAFRESMLLGQRLRYLALLFAAALYAASAPEQVRQDAVVNGRNIGGLVGAALIIVAMVVSMWESNHRRGLVQRRP